MNLFEEPKGFEILLVEDSATDAKLVGKALDREKGKSRLSVVTDGEAAMDLLRSRSPSALPDLVLLDLNLPKMDGWELLAECKGSLQMKAMPIVVFTTSQLAKDVHRCYELGANSFVAKPFELEPFLKAVRSIENYWLALSASYKG